MEKGKQKVYIDEDILIVPPKKVGDVVVLEAMGVK
jgi:hypothetical protein